MIHGERQMAPNMEQIKPDHRARYIFASQFVKHGDVVLDAICGIGYGCKLMSQMSGGTFMGFDRDEEAIAFGKKHYSATNVVLIQSDYKNFDFPPGAFTMATCFEAIEHVDDPELLVAKLAEWLKVGSYLLISTPNEDVMPWSKESFPEHLCHFTYNQMKSMLESNHFEVLSVNNQRDKYSFALHDGPQGNFMVFVARRVGR